MLRKFALASSVAVLCVGVAAGAQQPTPDPQRPDPTQQQPAGQQPTTQQPRASAEQTTTVEGCVYHERDIPGRTPNVAERAGVLEDYILVASTAPASTPGATGTTGTTGTRGTSGAAKMFKLEHKPDHQLSAMVGKRVQVTGKVDAERSDSPGAAAARPPQDQSVGPDRINLPEFEITSIREAQGECPAKPQGSR